MNYNWQLEGWPQFEFNLVGAQAKLIRIVDRAGQLQGAFQCLQEQDRQSAWIDLMVSEAIKTSEIEGESLNRPEVVLSIRNRLGLDSSRRRVGNPAAQGVGELMVAVRESWREDLTEDMVLGWHKLLMRGRADIRVGGWRVHEEPMRVVSAGPIGEQKLLFEAPPSNCMPHEMARFIEWFNGSQEKLLHGPVRAAIAHLYFESIHPFEDGNGRIGRVIAEKALSQGLGRPALLNLSQAIDEDRQGYYAMLGKAQQGLEISAWLDYFLDVVLRALDLADELLQFVLKQTRLLDRVRGELNERQMKAVLRMLREGPRGFLGGMNARKYAALTGASKATATRDLQDLVARKVLAPAGGGRSTHYALRM